MLPKYILIRGIAHDLNFICKSFRFMTILVADAQLKQTFLPSDPSFANFDSTESFAGKLGQQTQCALLHMTTLANNPGGVTSPE